MACEVTHQQARSLGFSLRKSSQVPDQSPFLGGSPSFCTRVSPAFHNQALTLEAVFWNPSRPSPVWERRRGGPGSRAEDSLRAVVLPSHCHCRWRRAGEEAAATPERGHVRKQNLFQCFSPFHPRGLSLRRSGSGAVGIARSHSCLPQRHSYPWSPHVSVPARLHMLRRPPWALPTMGVGRCGLGTCPLCVPAPVLGGFAEGMAVLDSSPPTREGSGPPPCASSTPGARAPQLLPPLTEPAHSFPPY